MSEEKFENEENLNEESVNEENLNEDFSAAEANDAPIVQETGENDEHRDFSESPVSIDVPKKSNKSAMIVIAVVAVLVVAVLALVGVNFVKNSNKYNEMGYINISGRTLDEVATASGKTLEEFKTEYKLPEDMKGNTEESAAYYMIPAEKMAEMNGITFDQLKEMLGLADNAELTGDMPWGKVEGEATLKAYVGETNIEEFKKYYELGDEITADTKWSEIRNIVDQKALKERIAEEEKEAAETPAADAQTTDAPAADAQTGETPAADTQTTDAPAAAQTPAA